MLRTRLWMGALLIVLVAAVLFLDREPYPFLLLLVLFLSLVAGYELHQLLVPARQFSLAFGLAAVLAIVLANWPAHLWGGDPWHDVLSAIAGVLLAAFLLEMATFREPGGSVLRLALLTWTVAYLAVLPSFLAQLRWWPEAGSDSSARGVSALALTIFVPKFCDIGAYFTGRFLGRHRMAPVLSPKKTWEGLAGGLGVSVLVAWAINRQLPVLPSDLSAVGFGLAVGAAGVLGDLAESLIKRDCRQKDASQVVPGFGGVLDVVDSILFAAPMAYWWLRG